VQCVSPMGESRRDVALSVIIPVRSRHADALELYTEYKSALDSIGQPYELIFVLDGPCSAFAARLRELIEQGHCVTVIGLTRPFGEATALMAGFEYASAQTVITLPAYHQIQAEEIATLVAALDDCDFASAERWPRAGGALERLRRSAFHGILAWTTGHRFKDLGCGARAFDRRVLEEIRIYGDLHRYLPVLADKQGFRVREIRVRQSPKDRLAGFHKPREYIRGFLDLCTIFFLVRFTKRPLRFFGMLGIATFAIGALFLSWLAVERLLFQVALADRPALLLSTLLAVLGMQLFALGLLGELIIFTHAKAIKDYQIERIIQFK
jgi:glycosyltransferase involved in cell wall biosynthesis